MESTARLAPVGDHTSSLHNEYRVVPSIIMSEEHVSAMQIIVRLIDQRGLPNVHLVSFMQTTLQAKLQASLTNRSCALRFN